MLSYRYFGRIRVDERLDNFSLVHNFDGLCDNWIIHSDSKMR